jgi:Tfp pilus assembly protein PilX
MLKTGRTCFRNQSGVALVIALIMIIVLTLIGLASVSAPSLSSVSPETSEERQTLSSVRIAVFK